MKKSYKLSRIELHSFNAVARCSRACLALLVLSPMLLARIGQAQGAEAPDAARERQAAQAAEAKQDWAAALLHYERLYDSLPTDEAGRSALRSRFAALRPKVAANADPREAGVWKVKAFAFRILDFSWKDQQGKGHHARLRLRDDEVEALRRAQASFADRVWEYSSGTLRIAWDLTVIDEPLTRMDGDYSFWPGPDACMPSVAKRVKPGEVDTLFVYAKVEADREKDEPSEPVPQALLGGALGAAKETQGATYIGINLIGFKPSGGMVEGEPSGEAELHEWLHSAQWALEVHQGYPAGLMFTSDGGRREGEAGGDPCYRRQPKEASWMRFYAHLMQSHVTRKMWRELSVRVPPTNVWASATCREFLVLGPLAWDGKPNWGLDEPFVTETNLSTIGLGKPALPGMKWEAAASLSPVMDLTDIWGRRDNHLAYLLVNARTDSATPAQLRLGSDDGCKVWQNGKLILHSPNPRACAPDQDTVDIQLAKGDNLFLLKVTNLGGGWCAIFRLTDRFGGPLPGVRYRRPGTTGGGSY